MEFTSVVTLKINFMSAYCIPIMTASPAIPPTATVSVLVVERSKPARRLFDDHGRAFRSTVPLFRAVAVPAKLASEAPSVPASRPRMVVA